MLGAWRLTWRLTLAWYLQLDSCRFMLGAWRLMLDAWCLVLAQLPGASTKRCGLRPPPQRAAASATPLFVERVRWWPCFMFTLKANINGVTAAWNTFEDKKELTWFFHTHTLGNTHHQSGKHPNVDGWGYYTITRTTAHVEIKMHIATVRFPTPFRNDLCKAFHTKY